MSNLPTDAELQERADKLGAVFVNESKLAEHIKKVDFYVHPDSCLTVCIITMLNDYIVIGESACADPKMFNKEIGQQYAFASAEKKIWPLLGYVLRDELYKQSQKGQEDTFVDRMKVEHSELEDRVSKLSTFINDNDYFKNLHEDQKQLLREQYIAMAEYHRILGLRIYNHS